MQIIPILPKRKPVNGTGSTAAIMGAMVAGVELIANDWKTHTSHYSGGVKLVKEIALEEGVAGSDDQRLVWNNYGTRPHKIRARNAKSLAFRVGGFQAKTQIRTIPSRGGSPASGPFVFPIEVNHPGTKAREIDLAIVAERSADIVALFRAKLAKAASG